MTKLLKLGSGEGARVLFVGLPPRHDLRFIVERPTAPGYGYRFDILWRDAEAGVGFTFRWRWF